MGLGPTLNASLLRNYLFEVPVSKYGHGQRYWGVGTSTGGGGSDTIQPVRNMVFHLYDSTYHTVHLDVA